MNQEKHVAIFKCLSENFPGCKIEQRHDFDRGAQTFKISEPNDTLLLRVADEFVDDNCPSEILRLFNLWHLPEVMSNEKKLGVLATRRGLESFRRS